MSVFSQNLQTLRATVRLLVNQPTNKFISDTLLNSFINIAHLEIAKYTEAIFKNENPAVVSSQANYDLPDDWFKTTDVQYQIDPTGSSPEFNTLNPITREEYLSLRTVVESTRPYSYTIYDNDLYLYPTPTNSSDEYLHVYVALPDELSDDTDIPFNAEKRLYPFHQVVADLTVNLVRANESGLTSQQAINAFIPSMEVMKKALSSKNKPGGGQVKRRRARGRYRPPYPTLPPTYPNTW